MSWEDQIRGKLEDFEMESPELPMFRHIERRRRIYALLAAAAAVLLCVFLLRPGAAPEPAALSETIVETAADDVPMMAEAPKEEPVSARHDFVPTSIPVRSEDLDKTMEDFTGLSDSEKAADESLEKERFYQNDVPADRKNMADNQDDIDQLPEEYKDADGKGKPTEEEVLAANEYWNETRKAAKKHGLSAGLSLANLRMGSSMRSGSPLSFNSASPMSDPMSDEFREIYAPSNTPHEDSPARLSQKHNRPVRAGLSLRYDFPGRWSLTSGVTYSYLYSKFTSEGDNYSVVTKQSLSFIGIPLKVEFRLLENPHWRAYATAGIMAEKMVGGRSKMQTIVAGSREGSGLKKLSMGGIQFSANAGVGIEYSPVRRFSIYLEPEFSQYIDNGSRLLSSYSEHPSMFDLSLGFRLAFGK